MDKPKELIGRAMPFIDIEFDFSKRSITDDINDFCEWRKFYSQPFTPEMLDYFEGWEKFQETEKWKYYQPVEETNIMVSAYENKDLYFVVCEDEQAGSVKLNVLNDFVTLCSLAGVELNWKE